MAPQERPVESLLEHVKPDVSAVEPDPRMRHPRRRNLRRLEDLGGEQFVEVRLVLNRIVEVPLVEPVKGLLLSELRHVERERGPLGPWPRTASRSLKLHRDWIVGI